MALLWRGTIVCPSLAHSHALSPFCNVLKHVSSREKTTTILCSTVTYITTFFNLNYLIIYGISTLDVPSIHFLALYISLVASAMTATFNKTRYNKRENKTKKAYGNFWMPQNKTWQMKLHWFKFKLTFFYWNLIPSELFRFRDRRQGLRRPNRALPLRKWFYPWTVRLMTRCAF
jgi:hypothetical protein